MSIEAMKQMVAEIDALPEGLEGYFSDSFADSISKLRQAIEQAEKQEPIRKVYICQSCDFPYADHPPSSCDCMGDEKYTEAYIYTTPQPQQAEKQEPVALEIIRKWPEGFQERLQHVWLDVVSFIPNVKLYDLQRVLAEFGFTMKLYEGEAPTAQQQEIDWKDQYEKQKRRSDMWQAKYEKDIGPIEKAGPVTARREWVGITTEEMEKSKPPLSNDAIVWELAVEWAEAKLKEKNT
jgi:hypothetical protein